MEDYVIDFMGDDPPEFGVGELLHEFWVVYEQDGRAFHSYSHRGDIAVGALAHHHQDFMHEPVIYDHVRDDPIPSLVEIPEFGCF
jgi:hypothetical protein